MNLVTAKKLNLDVYMFAIYALELTARIANDNKAQDREVFVFTDFIGTTQLNCVAVGPRKNAGRIARYMKQHKKTVREFIAVE